MPWHESLMPLGPNYLAVERDNLAWSAIFGAQTASKILGDLSHHLAPDKFYIAWPYGYYDPWLVREHRKDMSDGHVVLVNKNSTVKDNKYLAFTLGLDQLNFLIEESITTSSGLWNKSRTGKLSLKERYSYKNFDLSQVFKNIDLENYKKITIEDYQTIDCWEEYCHFLSTYKRIKKPSILKYSEWNEIGVDDE